MISTHTLIGFSIMGYKSSNNQQLDWIIYHHIPICGDAHGNTNWEFKLQWQMYHLLRSAVHASSGYTTIVLGLILLMLIYVISQLLGVKIPCCCIYSQWYSHGTHSQYGWCAAVDLLIPKHCSRAAPRQRTPSMAWEIPEMEEFHGRTGYQHCMDM